MASVNLDHVQGDVFSRGFPKIHETYYFFSILKEKDFTQKLAVLGKSGQISNLTKVLDQWRTVDARAQGEIIDVSNALIAFSMKGLQKIQDGQGGTGLDLVKLRDSDPAFYNGMANDSLNDIIRDWDKLFTHEIHGLLKVAGSDQTLINDKLHSIKNDLGHPSVIGDIAYDSDTVPTNQKSRLDGQVRPKEQKLNGREHFGFEDSVSQPLLKGIDEKYRRDFYRDDSEMHTEQNVIMVMDKWPFPHPRPDAQGDPGERPKWMLEGSFLVFRKLEQDVAGFKKFLDQNYAKVNCASADDFGARLMGRWKSGAPVVKHPDKDATSDFNVRDPKVSNAFNFTGFTKNHICPLAAHIRKMNPRDTKIGFAPNARIIRNGIPYGSEFSDAHPGGQRGLLFACYQSSIDNGFRFLQKAWANSKDFPEKESGFDAFTAQRPNNEKLTCAFVDANDKPASPGLDPFSKLVTVRGGEYFFVPSIPSLTSTLGKA